MRMRRQAVCGSLLLLLFAVPARAQLITIRTVPMSQGDQFDFLPSNNLGMAGLSIATADTLLDPFRNPAAASRVRSRFFTSPGVYSVSQSSGAGRTLPLGAFMRSGGWFGGGSFAIQQVDASQLDVFFPPIPLSGPLATNAIPGVDLGAGSPTHGNLFGTAMLGRVVAPGVSVAGSVALSRLRALDGVDMMYAGSRRVDQSGHSFDARLGLLRQWESGRTLQAVAVHNRYAMSHDVTYLDTFWNPGTQSFDQQARQDLNDDQTNIWGLHLQYAFPIPRTQGWTLGWVATANRMSHPKIPNYAIMNVPRDPGNSSAFNVGLGIAKRDGGATFGLEIVHEPIWSHTWADAAAPIVTPTHTIAAGEKTIENRFRFSNGLVRVGVGRDFELGTAGKFIDFQMGLVMRSIRYHLWQQNHVEATQRRMNQTWTEWTPTWGIGFRFPEFELRYRGAVTNGGGRPGVFNQGCCVRNGNAPDAGTVVVAPSGPMELGSVSVVSHQFSFSLPLGRSAKTTTPPPSIGGLQ